MHGYVTRVKDWPYKTFHRYVRQGLLLEDWAGGMDVSRTPEAPSRLLAIKNRQDR